MGKYDKEIEKEILSFKILYNSFDITNCINSPKEIYDNIKSNILQELYVSDMLEFFVALKNNLHNGNAEKMINEEIDLLKKQKYKVNDLIPLINRLIVYLLGMVDQKYTIDTIIQSVHEIYIIKNMEYGDIWYKRNSKGICLDMGRKIVRISNGHKTDNTIFDLLIYCVFLKVYLLYIEDGEKI